ncbi:MAG: glycosyltransferase family 39 protein [Bacteroidetes bacterium]|nr:glycosyltransferase family 39 protein [Bacteroidota bacterium]
MFFNPLSYKKFSDYINDKKNFYVIFFVLVIFLSILKLPPVFNTDIQPWDEGMYASRVLSIEKFGDFFDQSSHSVGKYYSGSHPPLLIWIGYAVSRVTGLNAVTLKLISYSFALLCLLFLMKIGTLLRSMEVGIFAAIIFSSNILFNIFSKRFQFDIAYTFFVILSFYFFFKYLVEGKKKFVIYCGIAAGLCLLSKLLVGAIVPIVLFVTYFILRRETKYSFKDFLFITGLSLLISLPWYVYLIVHNGNEALDYILNFHLYQRATVGIEQNAKSTGVFYFVNYVLTIIPYGFLAFYAIILNLKNFKTIDWKIKFVTIWFIIGMGIVTIFKTKLESYSFLFLPAACILIANLIYEFKTTSSKEKIFTLVLFVLNLTWYFTEHYRTVIKEFLLNGFIPKLEIFVCVMFLVLFLLFLFRLTSTRINLNFAFTLIVLVTFALSNVYYLIRVPYWEDGYKISNIKTEIDKNKEKDILYVSTDYRHNPQLTFYFNGADLNWGREVTGYNFNMIDTKVGTDSVKKKINQLAKNYFIIVEKDNINRAIYPDSKLFIPEGFTLISKTSGYELYKNF